MSKSTWIAVVMVFILIVTGIPFYWFAYRPKKVRETCLSISLTAAYESYKKSDAGRQRVTNYFRKHADLGDDSGQSEREAKDEALFLIAQQKDGYRICLEMNGLKE